MEKAGPKDIAEHISLLDGIFQSAKPLLAQDGCIWMTLLSSGFAMPSVVAMGYEIFLISQECGLISPRDSRIWNYKLSTQGSRWYPLGWTMNDSPQHLAFESCPYVQVSSKAGE